MRKYIVVTNFLNKRHRSASTILNETAVRKKDEEYTKCQGNNVNINDARNIRDYDEVPGPTAIPLLGNSWRFLPFVGERFWPSYFVTVKNIRFCFSDNNDFTFSAQVNTNWTR